MYLKWYKKLAIYLLIKNKCDFKTLYVLQSQVTGL